MPRGLERHPDLAPQTPVSGVLSRALPVPFVDPSDPSPSPPVRTPLATDPELKRAIETSKLRVPIEDLVRERVPALKKSGARYWACCPFHEENTPSFSVDPRTGLWYCFGACAMGGDQIHFLQRIDNLSFMEALEILAGRAGVTLPRNVGRGRRHQEDDSGLRALAAVDGFFQEQLRSREGRAAREYMEGRKLSSNTIEAFAVGLAPSDGQALIRWAREQFARKGEGRGCGFTPRDLERTGLIRRDDSGRPYSFFRGRLMIPIRDLQGRTVGFGGRRLVDGDTAGPKYINTSETEYFHKGRLIYGLDRALEAARRSRHLVLVEGYTDVMAAHQSGIQNVVAVLGTSTTEDHAGLVRRSGARRVSLVFDGDDAGRKAALKALHGLLPLEIELEAVRLPAGQDPCDLCLGPDGAQAFQAALDGGADWFDFVCAGLEPLVGGELAREVDGALELLARLKKPVHRDSMMQQMAERLNLPVASLREQWSQHPNQRRAAVAQRNSPEPEPQASADHAVVGEPDAAPVKPARPQDPRLESAWRGLVGALMLDASLVPLVKPWRSSCPYEEMTVILDTVMALYEQEDAVIDAQNVMDALAEHPARQHVALMARYASEAEAPESLLSGEISYLERRQSEREKRSILNRINELERASENGDEQAKRSLEDNLNRLQQLSQLTPSTPPEGREPHVLS
ncbi:MAG: DNA primase [Chlamydiales bacterium]|jgi:DNA primase